MTIFLANVMILVLAGCATAPYRAQVREIARRPAAGGILALDSNDHPADRAHADIVMKSNCGDQHVHIIKERLVEAKQRTLIHIAYSCAVPVESQSEVMASKTPGKRGKPP